MNWDKFENGFIRWFDKSFPKFVLGLVITVFCILIIGGIKGCITNSDKDYCVEFQDGSGMKRIYLNEGDFEIKDGRIIIKDGDDVYYLTNFKLINNK